MLKLKVFIILVIMFLVAYPVVELSRSIIVYNIIGGWPDGWQGHSLSDFYLELALIWGFYLCIPFILSIAFNQASGRR